MKKRVQSRAQTWIIAAAFLLFIAMLSAVLAVQTIRTSGGFTNASILEDRNSLMNITVNNSDFNQSGNVTGVTITLPSGLVYTTDTQNTSGNYNNSFTNSTTVLNWTNQSYFLVNGSVDGGGTLAQFWFNVSVTSPGLYTLVVRTFNATGEANYGNITVNVNDTTNGTARFVLPLNNTGTTSSIFNFSGNFTDNFNLSRVTLYIWNSTTLITPNNTNQLLNTSATNGTDALANFTFTFPREDRYFFNFLVNDTANNSAFNATNFSVVYDATRPLLEYNATGTENTGANVSRNWTFVNVTVTETNEVNITFTLYNSTALSNSTTFTSATRTINWTNLLDDRYVYNVTITDLVNFINTTTTRNITVDTTRPLAVFNDSGAGATSGDYVNVSRTWVFVNVTVTETNEANITFTLYNGTGSSANVTTFTDARRVINWTGLANGNYTYNVTITDSANNRNTTATRTIIIDTAAPSTSISKSSSTKTSLTIAITASDVTTGISGSCTVSGRPNAVVSGASSITESGLSCSTSYAYDVACSDFAGNAGSTSASFSTDGCGGGGATGGGGGGATTTAAAWTSTFVPEAAVVAQGYTRELAAKERVKVSVGGQAHHVGVTSVSGTSVTIEIASTPQNATLTIGETKKFEVTNDSFYDLALTLHSISGTKANLTIISIAEKIPESPAPGTGAAVQETANVTQQKQPATPSKTEREGLSPKTLWTTIVIVVVLIIVIVWALKKLRRSS